MRGRAAGGSLRTAAVRAVLAESMRLYSPAWILARQTKTASQIGAHEVPPRTIIFASQWVLHRDARFFSDPLTFMPGCSHPRYAYFPFGAGTRQCIGEGFAWMEGTLALAEVVRRWRLQLITDALPPLTAKVTLRPAAPVIVRVTPRHYVALAAGVAPMPAQLLRSLPSRETPYSVHRPNSARGIRRPRART
ncbi:MAG TPA: cytochrome P450 [Thermoanaerobaculia bacterium]